MVMWGDNAVLNVDHLNPVRSYYVGEPTDAKGKSTTDYLIGSELLGTRAHARGGRRRRQRARSCIPQGATGEISIGNDRMSVQRPDHQRSRAAVLGAGRALTSTRCRPVRPLASTIAV